MSSPCSPKTKFTPFISSIQKMALYETKARIFLVGSNNTQTKFRVLKIDRTEPKTLVVIDDHVEYSHQEIRDLLSMIDMGNRPRPRNNLGFSKTVSAFGIVGFVRFLEGYYIVLITKRRRIAVIGYHTIYKIEDTTMVYIPNESVRIHHPDEARYVKLFQSVDLSSNFYFSYSYDLSHTLQYNLSPPKEIRSTFEGIPQESALTEPGSNVVLGVKAHPNYKFVWNSFLLKPVESVFHADWILFVIHGFVGQSNISLFGKSLYLTLIARRSNKFAGTRFLKRGANYEGDVANEVETEQMVHDASVSGFQQGRYTSYVQLRGSVPTHWSQDISKMVPKPPILLDLSDAFSQTAAEHFNQLLRRYGSPVIVLNLVKKREKKRHEGLLTEEYLKDITYLNQFLPPMHQIQYIGFDMARLNKLKEANVMSRLADIASIAVSRTGIFRSFPPLHVHRLWPTQSKPEEEMESKFRDYFQQLQNSGLYVGRQTHRRQVGVTRVNCVDCLDRTNTAQFALGRCALAYQLYALGVVSTPHVEFDSDCVRMLEELYEDHGDTLALQYGGSQLVHRIKSYRRIAPWTSQGNDIMQSLSRYYSNTFSDADKQNAINLFLGVFNPQDSRIPIWEQQSDAHLHRGNPFNLKMAMSYTQWWDANMLRYLPLPYDEVIKSCSSIVPVSPLEVMVDGYYEFYRPFEFTVVSDLFGVTISHSVRDFMPNNCGTDFSPFAVRVRPGKRREELSSKNALALRNPSLTGQSSTSSTASGTSTESEDSSDDEIKPFQPKSEEKADKIPEKKPSSEGLTFAALLPSMKEVYGTDIHPPHRNDIGIYRKYANMAISSCIQPDLPSGKTATYKRLMLVQQSAFTIDNTLQVTTPFVGKSSLDVYFNYCFKGRKCPLSINPSDLNLYRRYASGKT
ncbi:polyphosphoinositide phosphatase [Daphnia magna]|uniref:Polyphosphoinositide phosphatase n=1 Tax=Daphnia magna TaxID=35525 RepID=A0A164ZGI6_9CRUS|nr:polyphosphoinositide phosphatase [Daphnia magna]KZS16333.1 Polyphosphoinositide phosphatase [Daphnia magna]